MSGGLSLDAPRHLARPFLGTCFVACRTGSFRQLAVWRHLIDDVGQVGRKLRKHLVNRQACPRCKLLNPFGTKDLVQHFAGNRLVRPGPDPRCDNAAHPAGLESLDQRKQAAPVATCDKMGQGGARIS